MCCDSTAVYRMSVNFNSNAGFYLPLAVLTPALNIKMLPFIEVKRGGMNSVAAGMRQGSILPKCTNGRTLVLTREGGLLSGGRWCHGTAVPPGCDVSFSRPAGVMRLHLVGS